MSNRHKVGRPDVKALNACSDKPTEPVSPKNKPGVHTVAESKPASESTAGTGVEIAGGSTDNSATVPASVAERQRRLAEETGVEASHASDPQPSVEELERIEREQARKVKDIEEEIRAIEKSAPAARNVDQPTAEEVEKHEASGHANFRRWCPDC